MPPRAYTAAAFPRRKSVSGSQARIDAPPRNPSEWEVERPTSLPGAPLSLEDPVVITCSISGAIANRDQCPAIPYTPEEYAAEARRIVDEGGVEIHIHARTPDGTPSLRDRGLPRDHRGDPGRGRRRDHQLLDRRDRRPDREAARLPARAAARRRGAEHELDELRQVLAARARTSSSRPSSRTRSTRSSSSSTAMNELGIKPEHECFDAGHVANLDPLLDMGLLEPPLQISLRDGRHRRHPAERRATSPSCPSRSPAAPRARTTGR